MPTRSTPHRIDARARRYGDRPLRGDGSHSGMPAELGSNVRILKWMVRVLIGLVVAGFATMGAAVFQISLRLPGAN